MKKTNDGDLLRLPACLHPRPDSQADYKCASQIVEVDPGFGDVADLGMGTSESAGHALDVRVVLGAGVEP